MAPAPPGKGGKGGKGQTAKQREALDHRYLQFLAAFVAKVNYLRPGETLVAPGGWRTGGKAGHAVMHVAKHTHSAAVCRFLWPCLRAVRPWSPRAIGN